MRVAAATGPGRLEVVDVSFPRVDTEALVHLERAGICGTDLKILDGSTPVSYPRVLGHELVGAVAQAPPEAKVAPGARVLVNPGINCGDCYLCHRDRPHLRGRGGLLGRDFDGVFAEAISLEERFLHPVPDQIPPDEAGLLQVLGTVVHSQQPVAVSSDTVAVVIGLGVSGILHTQLLSDRGAGLVIGVSRSPWKLELAKGLGADLVATPDEASDVVARASSGRGADLVIESVGKEETVVQSIHLAAPGGDVIIYGTVTGGGTEMPYYQLYFKELTLHNPRAAVPRDYDEAIRLAADGRIRLAPLITARYPLEEAGAAFAAAGSGDHLKVLLTP